MDLGLRDRRALVTGSSKGLGRACAEALIQEGARVFICSRNAGAIARTAGEIGAAGHRAADMAVQEDVEATVRDAVEVLGGLDILVTNAGGPPPSVFQSTDLQGWDRGYQLTLMSAVRLIKFALPELLKSEQGRIVNITSISVRQPILNLVLSNSFRGAVTGMAKSLSLELAPHRITVNNLAPGSHLTDRIRETGVATAERTGRNVEQVLEDTARQVPVGRLGDPAEFGAACAFLCSRQAAFITGQTLGADGGALLGVH